MKSHTNKMSQSNEDEDDEVDSNLSCTVPESYCFTVLGGDDICTYSTVLYVLGSTRRLNICRHTGSTFKF